LIVAWLLGCLLALVACWVSLLMCLLASNMIKVKVLSATER